MLGQAVCWLRVWRHAHSTTIKISGSTGRAGRTSSRVLAITGRTVAATQVRANLMWVPFWEEDRNTNSWVWSVIVYSSASCFALGGGDLPRWARWLVVFVVLHTWCMLQRSSIWLGARKGATGSAVIAAILQIAFLVLFSGWTTGIVSDSRPWTVGVLSLLPLGVGAGMVLSVERKNHEPLPRYALEALLFTCLVAWVAARLASVRVHVVVWLLVIHLWILCFVLVRNYRIVAKRSPVVVGDVDAAETWQVGFRDVPGWKALTASLSLPSGVVGLVFVGLDLLLTLSG